MKDSPAVILASGLTGLVGSLVPTAKGWFLEESLMIFDFEVSAESLGFFVVSKLLFLPALLLTVAGGMAMMKKFASRKLGLFATLCSIATLGAWYVQKATISGLSIVGVAPALGLFLLLVSGLGGIVGGLMLTIWPQNKAPTKAP